MSPIVREYYRVPREDRQVYLHPPAAEQPALVERNRRLIGSWNFEFAGQPLAEFRAEARAEIMALARRYAERWGFWLHYAWAEPMPIITTGHQPPPFHPGVWFKNFLAGSLARAVGGTALNLTVDNDEVGGQVMRFPVRAAPRKGGPEEVRVVEKPLAKPSPGVAFEEERIANRANPDWVCANTWDLPRPLRRALRHTLDYVGVAWSEASNPGEAMGVARHRLEEYLGLRNPELPVSQLADSEAFRLFLAAMIARHEELFAAYNGSLAEYRRVYHERSAAQPMPDLARDGSRVELPFWVWRAGAKRKRQRQRQRLWVEPTATGALALYADHDKIGKTTLRDTRRRGVAAAVAAQVARLRRAGWKIRPKALTLTLFVRLAVGDVFIHGLGGALYDKITDGIFERFFGVQPPEYVLASCTVRLPLEGYPSTPRDLGAAQRAVRDWRFNPDRVLSAAALARPEVQTLVAEKRRLIEGMSAVARGEAAYWAAASREARRRAYLRIHEVNALLAALEPAGPPAAADTLARVQRELRYNAILWDREYPFWLYPPEDLEAFYWQCLEPAAGAAGDPQRG
jgi:hypothetical protein